MKSKILKIVLGLILFSALFITVSSAATTVKENVQNYDDIIYIIGSTRFDSDVIITAQRAANAGVSEAKRLVSMGKPDEIENLNLKTYCYNPYFDEWYEIQEEARNLTKEEIKNIEENLNIFFVNNEEKTLEIEFDGVIDENSIVGPTNATPEIKNKKIIIPATWIEGFQFTSEGTKVEVKLSEDNNGKVEELDKPVIKKQPTITLSIAGECFEEDPIEFTLKINANDFAGEELSGNIMVNPKGTVVGNTVKKMEYYDEATKTWVEVRDMFNSVLNRKLETQEIKGRITFETKGEYTIRAMLNIINNTSLAENKDINVVENLKYVAKVGQNYYEDLAKAIENATDSTVRLLKDVTLTKRLNITNNVTLDLSEHTINIEGVNNKIAAQQNAKVTIKNGNVISNTNYGLQAQDNAILNIEKDLNIKVSGTDGNAEQYGITMFDKATLNFEGNIVVECTGKFASGISGSGNEPKTTNTTINITGGSITVEEGIAVYQPQVGTLNITAGTLEANTVLGIKSGEITVSGGVLKATGAKNEAGAMSENIKLTGDVVYIEENTAYYGNVNVNITNGELTSANGYIIQEFNPTIGTEKERNAVVTGNYETRTMLENNVTIFTATSEASLETAKGTKYVAENLGNVMNNPTLNGGTVTLLKDIDAPETMELTSKVILELNDCNLTIKEDTVGWGVFRVLEGGDLTINGNGIVDGTGKNDWNMVICAKYGNITINGGTYTNTNIVGDDDHYDVIYAHESGKIVINGGRFEGKTPAWLLNINDNNRKTASIEVKGGEFVGFDPANNKAEGEGTNFVADGYKSVEKDGVYTVVPVE